MTKDFFETIVVPSSCFDIFADFILETTSEAIEEISLSGCEFEDFTFCCIDREGKQKIKNLKQQAIIVRSNFQNDKLIDLLQDFSLILSVRLDMQIGFAYKTEKKKNEDWINKYKESIQPIMCGGFYIRPSWFDEKVGLQNIVIDPALAFGSGHHATTSMCIEMLTKINLVEQKLLDVGCGSGILGLVAKKLGATVQMCDTDLMAVAESKKNFILNHEEIDSIWQGSIEQSKQIYDVIVANILADVIKILYNDFCKALRSGSLLILSGILEKYKDDIIYKFSDFELQEILYKDEWVALKMIKK